MVAVITADIVNSTKLTSAAGKKLINKLNLILAPYRFEFYRGDSFQVYLKDPGLALALICRVRAAARIAGAGCDIRASIGIGNIKFNPRKLSTATGEAFTLSGRAFDEMKGTDRQLIMQASDSRLAPALRILGYFADYIYKNLTPKQAEVIMALLEDNTQHGAARKLKKSQSTINKHARAAGWNELTRLLKEYAELIHF